MGGGGWGEMPKSPLAAAAAATAAWGGKKNAQKFLGGDATILCLSYAELFWETFLLQN